MSQYKTGLVDSTAGSSVITGSGTLWLGAVAPGDEIQIGDNPAFFIVASVASDTSLTVTVPMPFTVSGEEYVINSDFTANLNLPKVAAGDLSFPETVTRAFEILDATVAAVGAGTGAINPTPHVVRKSLALTGLGQGSTPLFRVQVSGGGSYRIDVTAQGVRHNDNNSSMVSFRYLAIEAHEPGGARRITCGGTELVGDWHGKDTDNSDMTTIMNTFHAGPTEGDDGREDWSIDFTFGGNDTTPAMDLALEIEVLWRGYNSAPVISAL